MSATATDISAADTSVIICAFADERLELTVACAEAALAQDPPPLEVILVIDHNEHLAQTLAERLPDGVRIMPNAGERGLSANRNTAIAAARGGILAFLDDDAKPHPGWLDGLLKGFGDPKVVGVGGRANATWQGGQPGWFPNAFLWVVGCSFDGQEQDGPTRNPIGCNMAFRRELFDRAGVFDTKIGRLGKRPLGCEETEICIRAAREMPGTEFRMMPGAEIDHFVSLERREPKYLVRRCYYEGISKALVRTLGDTRSLDTEKTYVRVTLVGTFLRGLRQGVLGPRRGDGLGRAVATVAGLSAAAWGYIYGTILLKRPEARR